MTEETLLQIKAQCEEHCIDFDKQIIYIKETPAPFGYRYLVGYAPISFEDIWQSNYLSIKPDSSYTIFDIRSGYSCVNPETDWLNPNYADIFEQNGPDSEQDVISDILLRVCGLRYAATPSSEEFSKKLTTLEKEAFAALKKKIGKEGNISIVKMIQETSISRPIWTSLLNKLKTDGIAEVESQGVKGTHIYFI